MKKKVGYYLPAALADAYEEVAKRVGEREKSQVIGAAILFLLEAPEDVKDAYIRRVRDAGGPGRTYEGLVAEAIAVAKKSKSKPPHPDGHVDFAGLMPPPKPRGGSTRVSAPSGEGTAGKSRQPSPAPAPTPARPGPATR